MTPDWLLLRRYTQDNSQEAFALLTARYLNLVYAVCLREVHDPELAQDVTQAVFLLLARTAPAFRSKTALPGWLFRTARFASQNARTREQRRRHYEEKAAREMDPQESPEDPVWADIKPLLNQSLAALSRTDRDCVLLRFFQGLSFAEVGTALGLSEEAARKRVTRSLEKLRHFFTKEGVIVPALALPVLLTAHAAKAAPAACQANIAQLTQSVLAGHTVAALTGSHAIQISQGALNAMKVTQIKVAAGVTAAVVIGLTTYAVARGVAAPHSKPGHVLQQVPGKTLTAAQIAARCQEAYGVLQSYQITSTVDQQSVTASDASPAIYHTSAKIQFVKPHQIRVQGIDLSQSPYAYISNGVKTEETNASIRGAWREDRDVQMAVASTGGISSGAATLVPALLLNLKSGKPLALINPLDAEVREDDVSSSTCYVLTASSNTSTIIQSQTVWIDEKTFLLRRAVSDTESTERTFFIAGQPHTIPAMKSHDDNNFTNERINKPVSDTTFTLPALR